MKNKKSGLVLLLVFVLLMGGAYVLYDRLGADISPSQMLVHATQSPENKPVSDEAVSDASDADVPEASVPAEDEPVSDDAGDHTEDAAHPDHEETEIYYAPDFHVYDREGNAVHLSDFFGKPIVLNFWASWCGPCQSEMPDFNAKYAELEGEVHFVMVNMTDGVRETVESASAYIDANGYRFPVFYDTTGEAAMTYGAYSLPTSFFINAQGHLIAQAIGAIDAELLQTGLDMISE